MKILRIILISVLIASVNFASEKTTKTNLEKAKVFIRGVELTHSAKINLDAGPQKIVLRSIGDQVDPNSIQVKASDGVLIYSVSIRSNFLEEIEKDEIILSLEKKLDGLWNQNDKLRARDEILKLEVQTIVSHGQKSESQSFSSAKLNEITKYYNDRMLNLSIEISQIEREMEKLEKSIANVKKQIQEQNNKLNKPINEIVVEANIETEGDKEFLITYFSNDASWYPGYNIRGFENSEKIEIEYFANVTQNTGLNWKEAEIIISSRNPNQNNTKPDLPIWFINFQQRLEKRMVYDAPVAIMQAESRSKGMADLIVVDNNQLSVDYIPQVIFEIPSDNKPHIVMLQNSEAQGVYKFYGVPKYDSKAFLVAEVKNFDLSTYIAGNANVFYDGSFIGKTYINPDAIIDDWQISFGKDNRVNIEKKLVKDFSDNEFLGGDKERIFTYEYKITNNKGRDLELIVEDNIPVAQNEDIEVELIEISSAKYNKKLGKLEWKLNIPNGGSKTIPLKYSVTYPKDAFIPGL
ncbi:MAG: mucoidy inhibitor MuiA family protein [Melioribacteraceae bacterium]|nr:mucoidy inhibitor MuiA family protein [Melioribacteraceae bacterium]